MSVSAEIQTIDLLCWLKARGFAPKKPRANDRFLCLITKKIYTYAQLNEHQKRTSVWIPNTDEARRIGIPVKTEEVGGIIVAKSSYFTGAGPGKEEAMLSLLNKVRLAKAA